MATNPEGAIKPRPVLDPIALPGEGFSHHASIWWGNGLMLLIEGAAFAVLVLTYFYIWRTSDSWPPTGILVPDIGIGMLNLAILVVSVLPMWHVARLALRNNNSRVLGYWLLACVLFGFAAAFLRLIEFKGVHTRWNSNPYGAIVWSILAVHFAHILAASLETLVLAILMLRGPVEEKHYGDITVNAVYWYFVALSWVGLWTVVYLAPRVI
jgi:heme/copper-type cytochrome/quinol oxidase subunit 3